MTARVQASDFTGDIFGSKIRTVKHGRRLRYVQAWVSFDTETYADAAAGWIVAWSSTISYQGEQVTVWGRTVDEALDYFDLLARVLSLGEYRRLPVYVHNFSYDYMFLRNFLLERWGVPASSLAVKTHRYITMAFHCGIEFKDSYILAQCSLAKWARDLGASTQKAMGSWEYDRLRTPSTPLTPEEVNYVCADAEALTECVQLKAAQASYGVGSIPLTATGYARDAARNAAFADAWQERVHVLDMSYPLYERCSRTFWGGMVHGDRHQVGMVLHDVLGFDFASSYPFVMCVEKFPCTRWVRAYYSLEEILRQSGNYAFMCDLILIDARIKPGRPMPPIPQSKCTMADNRAVWDNGKLIRASIISIPVNEIDLQLYLDNYDYDRAEVGLYTDKGFAAGDVYTCKKDYLPRWFVQTICSYFRDKTMLKGSDAQQYQYAKALLNSQYGMCAQRPVRPDVLEDFEAPPGEEWSIRQTQDPAEQYAEYLGRYNYFLPYQWGMYVTAYARRNLYKLGACCSNWIYCDTDSVKGTGWDMAAVASYNEEVRRKLKRRGISPILFNGREYAMGIAEHDATYSEFITLGAKRYAYRDAEDGQLHITVAGVPKAGVEVLQNDIYKFARGLVFHDTGKLMPEYHTEAGIRERTVEGCRVRIGSWINLVPADYLLDMTDRFDSLLDVPLEWDEMNM